MRASYMRLDDSAESIEGEGLDLSALRLATSSPSKVPMTVELRQRGAVAGTSFAGMAPS